MHQDEDIMVLGAKDGSIIHQLRKFITNCYKRVDNIIHNMTNTTSASDTLFLQVRSQDQDDVSVPTDTHSTCPTETSTVSAAVSEDLANGHEVFTQDIDLSHDNLHSQTSECKVMCDNACVAQSELRGNSLRLKVAINNISGLGVRTKKLHRVVEWMQEQQFDILMAQEANVHFKHHQVRHYLRQVLKSGYHIVTSESEFNFKTPTKPGGTFILTSRLFRSRILKKIIDPVGRWAGNIYSFSGDFKIALISVYQICQWKNTGGTTFRAQQVAWLLKNNRNEDPITAHRKDLMSLIDSLREEQIEILLGGDLNEHDEHKGTLLELSNHGMIQLNTDLPRESYLRGQTCIDHMFVTYNLLQKLQDVRYLQYPTEYDTDHRPMSITLNVTNKLSLSMFQSVAPERKLFSNNWTNVRKYISRRVSLHNHYKIDEKLTQIEHLFKDQGSVDDKKLSHQIFSLVDKVDKQNTQLCLEAERCLQHRKRYSIPAEVRDILRALANLRYDIRICKQVNDFQKIKALMKMKHQKVRNLIQAYKNQGRLLHQRLQAEIEGISSLESCGKKVARRKKEEMRRRNLQRIYQKIAYYTGKRKDAENIKLKSGPNWIHDPDEILAQIVQHNKEHFAQARGCFFSQPELQELVDPNSSVFDDVIMSKLDKSLLQELQGHQLEPIEEQVDIEVWGNKFRTWKESTRTSPSGMHLGHFKSLLVNIYEVNDQSCEVDLKLQQEQQELFDVSLRILNLAIASEQPLTRWRTATNIVIPKKKDAYDVKNLRNIHIYECDLNALLSLKWKEASSAAETMNFLVPCQFGSRKERSSHNPVYIETAQLEIARLARKQYGQINYDARACYDRILPNLAAMTSLVHGVPKRLVILHNMLLRNMNYEVYIKGASKNLGYKSSNNSIVYGTGQGCGNSPFIWLFLSNILLKIFNRQAIGAQYSSHKNCQNLLIQATAYVDDINTHHNADGVSESIEYQMKQDFIHWKSILETSGGSLAPEKCNYYKVDWSFHNSGRPEMLEGHDTLICHESTGVSLQNIDQKHRTLGFIVSPKRPRMTQLQQWREIEDRFRLMLDLHGLQYREVEILYKRIYIPTIRYLLPFMTLQDKEIHDITKSTVTAFLRNCGYSNTTARKTVFGTRHLGGLGWFDMEVEQGLHNLATLVQSCFDGGIMEQLYQNLLEKWCWFIGFCPLTHHTLPICYDESTWLSSIDNFLKKHGITLSIESQAPSLLRENDQYIMIIVLTMNLSPTEIRYINYCRLYQNVISIADLTDEGGRYICQEFYTNPSRNINSTISNCVQQAPPIRKWSLWRKVLNHLTVHNRRKLKQNLGKWIVPSHLIRRKYPYYSDTHRLYHQTVGQIYSYELNNRTKGNEIGEVLEIPQHAYPCDISSDGQLRTDIAFEIVLAHPEIGVNKDFQGGIIAVTDASVIGNHGTWSAIITDMEGKELHQSQGTISGDGLTSFRAELEGCRAVMVQLQKFPNATSMTLFCDNIAVIHRLNTLKTSRPSINWSDYDLLVEAKKVMPSQIQFKHVRGHQGVECSHEFNLETNLNILMDMRAKQAQDNKMVSESQRSFKIIYKGETLTGPLVKILRQRIGDTTIQSFYQEKMKEHYQDVYWDAFKFACVKFKVTRSVFKLIHNIAPTMQTFHSRHLSHDALCPRCFEEVETHQHILTCSSHSEPYSLLFCEQVKQRLKLTTDDFDGILDDIFWSISTGIQGRLQTIVFSKQQCMGWQKVIRGFFTTEWIEVAKLFKTEKCHKEIVGSFIIAMWTTWQAAWNQRNKMFKKEDRYSAQSALKQRTIELHVMYRLRDFVSDALKGIYKSTVEEHLKSDPTTIDNWLQMHMPIIFDAVTKEDKDIWRRTEDEVLDSMDM